MSSNIEVIRICEYCKNEFTARTTRTRYCSHNCNSRAYKERVRNTKVKKSNTETHKVKTQDIIQAKAKEFLNVNEACLLIGISRRTVYRLFDSEQLNKYKIGTRTIIKRSELDKLLETPQIKTEPIQEVKQYDISECYTINEVIEKYNISSGALYNMIKRNGIPKTQKGKFVYVPKILIDNLLK